MVNIKVLLLFKGFYFKGKVKKSDANDIGSHSHNSSEDNYFCIPIIIIIHVLNVLSPQILKLKI